MELRTYLKTNFIGTEKAVHEKVMNEMKDFFDKLESADADPQSIYYTWIKGNRSEMAKIGRILLNEYGIITNPGYYRPRDSTFVTSVKSFNIRDYVRNKYDYTFYFDSSKYHSLDYNQNVFYYLAQIGVAMLINKFDVSSLSVEHVMYQVLMTLFSYFRLYEKKETGCIFLIEISDIQPIIRSVLELDKNNFDNLARYFSFYYDSTIAYKPKALKHANKPTCKEDITECIKDGMTQTQKKEAIMSAWKCGSSTARKYMQLYGLTDTKYARKTIHCINSEDEKV